MVGQVPFCPVRQKARRTGDPEVESGIGTKFWLLGDRLMVGQVPLEHFVQVRILVAQPEFEQSGSAETSPYEKQDAMQTSWRIL